MFLSISSFFDFTAFISWVHNCFITILSYFTSFFEILFSNPIIKYSLMIGILMFFINVLLEVYSFIPTYIFLQKRNREIHDIAKISSSLSNSNRDIVSASYRETFNEHGYSKIYQVYGNHSRQGSVRK